MTQKLQLSIFVLCFSMASLTLASQGEIALEQSFQSIQSPELQIIRQKYEPPVGMYPFWYPWVVSSTHWWIPKGATQVVGQKCSMENYQSLLDKSQNVALTMRDYLNQCSEEVQIAPNVGVYQVYKMFNMKLQQHEHPYLRRVMIQLPNGIKIKALLGLKSGEEPRPLVIIRGGVHSTIDEMPPERFLLMQLFEQSPYHVLVLGNMTGLDFIENNSKFAFGGFDEGIQNIQIAKLITNSQQPISRKISEVALAGLSLGGHGVFFSAMLNKLNGAPFKSFIGLCPVVNLQPTMKGLLSPLWKAWVVDFWTLNREKKFFEKNPEINLPSKKEVFFREGSVLQTLMDAVAQKYAGGLSYAQDILLPMSPTPQKFWQANDFWKHGEPVDEKFLLVYNKKDPLVNPEENVKLLPSQLWQQAVLLENGIHCTIPIGYDWEFLRASFETFLRKGFKFRESNQIFKILPNGQLKAYNGSLENRVVRKYGLQRVSVDSLTLELSDGDTRKIILPLGMTDYEHSSAQSSYFEMMQRWLAARVQVFSVGEELFLLRK